MKKLNKLAQLAKIERYIAQFQKLSELHERTLENHNDQLEFTWHCGYDKAVHEAEENYKDFQESINKITKQNTDLSMQVRNLKNEPFKYETVSDATPRHTELHTTQQSPQPLFEKEGLKAHSGWIVQNWHKGWLWLSNWIFILIAWVAYNGIPPELLALIPEANRENVIPILSALGVICRFIDQSRKKQVG